MSFVLDMLHLIAATLLAVIGFGYEREEECDPVHYEPAAYTVEATADGRLVLTGDVVFVAQDGTIVAPPAPTPASDCDSDAASVIYPVL